MNEKLGTEEAIKAIIPFKSTDFYIFTKTVSYLVHKDQSNELVIKEKLSVAEDENLFVLNSSSNENGYIILKVDAGLNATIIEKTLN